MVYSHASVTKNSGPPTRMLPPIAGRMPPTEIVGSFFACKKISVLWRKSRNRFRTRILKSLCRGTASDAPRPDVRLASAGCGARNYVRSFWTTSFAMRSVRIPRGQTGKGDCIPIENVRLSNLIFPHLQKIHLQNQFLRTIFQQRKNLRKEQILQSLLSTSVKNIQVWRAICLGHLKKNCRI